MTKGIFLKSFAFDRFCWSWKSRCSCFRHFACEDCQDYSKFMKCHTSVSTLFPSDGNFGMSFALTSTLQCTDSEFRLDALIWSRPAHVPLSQLAWRHVVRLSVDAWCVMIHVLLFDLVWIWVCDLPYFEEVASGELLESCPAVLMDWGGPRWNTSQKKSLEI